MADKRDFYEVLGVSKSSTQPEIKKAFKSLAKKYHPDISKEENAEEKFKEVQEAYAVLSDEDKRAKYDQFGHSAFEQGGYGGAQDFDFSDIFSEIFGGGGSGFGGFGGFSGFGGGQPDPNAPRSGRDMELNVTLTFKEAVFGTKKDITVKREQDCSTCGGSGAKAGSDVETCATCGGQGKVQRQQQTLFGMAISESICPDCKGQGKTIKDKCPKCSGNGREVVSEQITVNFPSGVDNGSYLRVSSKGEGGFNGGPDGNLFINVYVKEDKFFKRKGNDIHIEIPIDYTQAALGDKIDVPTIYGDVSLKIPESTQSGSTLRVKQKGIKKGNKMGDQYIKVKIVTPKKISTEMRKILEELKVIEQKNDSNKSFFDNVKKFFK